MSMFVFWACLALTLFIGFWASVRSKAKVGDFYTASSGGKPWVVALSLFSSYQSGYLFLGAAGYIFVRGLSGGWLLWGSFLGEATALLWGVYRLKSRSWRHGALTFEDLLDLPSSRGGKTLFKAASLLILLVAVLYSGSQFLSLALTLSSLSVLSYKTAVFLCFGVLLAYSFRGGMRASLWTDAFQTILMLAAAAWIFFVLVFSYGDEAWGRFLSGDPYFHLWPLEAKGGVVLYILGWAAGGAAILGQPHVMNRLIALEDSPKSYRAAFYFMGLKAVFNVLIIGAALLAHSFLPQGQTPDLVLVESVKRLLPSLGVGLAASAIFAAVASTVSSQLLAATGSLMRFFPNGLPVWIHRMALFGLLLIMALLALYPRADVFHWVIFVYGIYGSVFAPPVFFAFLGLKPKPFWIALASGVGLLVLFVCHAFKARWGFGDVYEILPAIGGSVLILGLGSWINSRRGA